MMKRNETAYITTLKELREKRRLNQRLFKEARDRTGNRCASMLGELLFSMAGKFFSSLTAVDSATCAIKNILRKFC